MKVTQLKKCRICSNENLNMVLDLGIQELTGVFPKNKNDKLTEGPLQLVFCPKCGLLQLAHSYELSEMYGMNYGYRSGLNVNMVNHLQNKVGLLEHRYHLTNGDTVVDIGSNDGTTLNAYSIAGVHRIGIDPTGIKFKQYYDKDISLLPEFFSVDNYKKLTNKSAKIVTSISMFYDLESPIEFAASIEHILARNGVWHFEQSYMPAMLRQNAYDTVCHEHLEYYSLSVVKRILDAVDMRIIDVSFNDVNGGSFSVTAAKKKSDYVSSDALIEWLLEREDSQGLNSVNAYINFSDRVKKHRHEFKNLLKMLNDSGEYIYGYGASTKGNVLLQYCGFNENDIVAIGEVNRDKFGAYTPKTHIPIISEDEVKQKQPAYILVLPWHFRDMIINKERAYLQNGGKFIFPLPYIEVV